MSAWTDQELRSIGEADELELASRRADGSLGRFTTMWVVRVGDDLYVRSAGGAGRPWFQHAMTSGVGRIRAGAVDAGAEFTSVAPAANAEIDAQYHAKYDRYGQSIVGHVTGPTAHAATIQLIKAVRMEEAMSEVVVVAGAGQIGLAIARRVSAGRQVVLADLHQSNADAAAEVLADAGFDATATTVDVSSRGSVQQWSRLPLRSVMSPG